MTYALGIMCHGWHESAAVMVRDGTVLAAAEEERFTRRKLDSSFPSQAISFCLAQAGIRPAQLSAVGFGFDLSRKRFERARHVLRYLPGSLELVRTRMPMAKRMANIKDEIRAFLRFDGPIYTFNHHLCHAASTFYSSPFETAAILTMDGAGDWESCWWGHASGSDLRELGTIDWPLSLGHIYAAVPEYCGFKAFHDEYKLMGLAAYGRPALMDAIRKIFWPTESGFDVDLDYFTFHLGRVPQFSRRFVSRFGPPLTDPGSGIPDPYRDLAASVQRQVEEVILHLARKVLALTVESRLCLAGGVALNAVANGRIARETGIESLYVPPYVLISSVDAYEQLSDPARNDEAARIDPLALTAYGFHKALAEMVVRRYAAHWTLFRLGPLVGPGLRKNPIFDLLTAGRSFVSPASAYPYIDTREVGRIVAKLMTDEGEIFNVCGRGEVELADVARTLNVQLDRQTYELPEEHYRINVEKLAARVVVPESLRTVEDFTREWRQLV